MTAAAPRESYAIVRLRRLAAATLLVGLCAAEAAAQLGDPINGQALFNARGCASGGCHDGGSNKAHLRGASLSLAQTLNATPIAHPGGPTPWQPAFSAVALKDLAAYLSSQDPSFYLVSGEVFAQGSPSTKLAGVDVQVSSSYLPVPPVAYATDGNGDYSVTNLAAGDYTVKALDSAYLFSPPLTSAVLTTLGVRKAGGPPMAGTTLQGVDFAGQAQSAGLSLYNSKCAACHTSVPADNVDGVLSGARLSILQAEAVPASHGGQSPSPFAGLQASQQKTLAAFLSSQDATTYSISGTLLDIANGLLPINDNNIEIQVASSYLPGVTVKTSAGTFQLNGLRAGDYRVTPSHVAYSLLPVQVFVGLDVDGVQGNLGDPSTFVPNTTALTGLDFQGQMQEPFASGKQVYATLCLACHGNPSEVFDPLNPSNPPTVLGKYNAALYGAAVFTLFQDLSYSPGMNSAMGALTVADRDTLAAYLSISHPVPFELEGRVGFTSGLAPPTSPGAVAGATITVESTLFPEIRTTTTGEQGHYHLDGLWGGPKTVTVSRPGYDFTPSVHQIGAHPFAIQVGKLPRWLLFDQDFSGQLDVDTALGQSIYASRCSGCHGPNPGGDVDQILVGARLSVLRAIRFVSVPQPVLEPVPPTEDETAPPYGTSHTSPLNVFALIDDELRSLAAYIASFDPRSYRISGSVAPSATRPDPSGLVVSLFSETVEGAGVVTDAQGDYSATGLRPGDYLVSLPEERTTPAWRKAFVTSRLLGIRNVLSISLAGFAPGNLPFVDFDLANPYLFSAEVFKALVEMLSMVEDGGGDAAWWEERVCSGRRPQGRARGFPGSFLRALETDAENLTRHRIDLAIAGPAARNLEGTELELLISWDRTATIRNSGETWVRPDGLTSVRLEIDRIRGGLVYCGAEGDPLIGLSRPSGHLVLDAGSVDGVEISGRTVVKDGELVFLNGKRVERRQREHVPRERAGRGEKRP